MVSSTSPAGVLPPLCNTGVTLPGVSFVANAEGCVSLRFDYYRASVDADLERLVDLVRRSVGCELREVRGLYSYERGLDFVSDSQVSASVFYGAGRPPLLQASGVCAQAVYEAVSVVGLDHLSLARADVCVDSASGSFESADSVLREIALSRNVGTSVRGDWDTPGCPAGRTRYVGSRLSFRFRRLYEFLKFHGYGSPWRYELEVKPTSAYKAIFGAMGPADILRSDDLSRRFLNRLGVDLSRLVVRSGESVQPSSPFDNLARQYSRVLSDALASRCGDLAALGGDLMAAVARVREERDRVAASLSRGS